MKGFLSDTLRIALKVIGVIVIIWLILSIIPAVLMIVEQNKKAETQEQTAPPAPETVSETIVPATVEVKEPQATESNTPEIAGIHYFLKERGFLYSETSEKSPKINVASPYSSGPVEVSPDEPLTVVTQKEGWTFVRLKRDEWLFAGWVRDGMIINPQEKEANDVTANRKALLAMDVVDFAKNYGRIAGLATACSSASSVPEFSDKARKVILSFNASPKETTEAVEKFNYGVETEAGFNALNENRVYCKEIDADFRTHLESLSKAGF